jgi:extracellular factor (EF) 3-hydroxypalmitic acid methyl ester biosynthesis protein
VSERLNPTDSLLVFSNSQGIESRGTLMHLSRQSVVFEVYNPYSIVQLSEVLNNLSIRRGNRAIYQGRAVVSNLMNTGLMLIVSATLVDPWSDLANLAPGKLLRGEIETFIADWQGANQIIAPDYRVSVSIASNFLEELSQWLSQGEIVSGINDRQTSPDTVREFVGDVEGQVLPKLYQLFGRFEDNAKNIDPDKVFIHKEFARRQLHPLLMCAPFLYRTYTKPLGYAGDYEMVNMMFRDRWEGGSTYAKIMNALLIHSDGALAHRNRIDKLIGYLSTEAARVMRENRPLRVLNVACGPAIEIQRFIRESPISDRCHLSLLDFNGETLNYTRSRIQEAIKASGRLPDLEFIHKSVHELLQEARGRREGDGQHYDLVYCAGLFDYLSDKVCARLLELFVRWTSPGGLTVATNVHPQNPVRYFMEHLLEWNLVYRDNQEMLALRPGSGNRGEVTNDSTGVNVFLEMRRDSAP